MPNVKGLSVDAHNDDIPFTSWLFVRILDDAGVQYDQLRRELISLSAATVAEPAFVTSHVKRRCGVCDEDLRSEVDAPVTTQI